jgi:Ner family transcriptional regulator
LRFFRYRLLPEATIEGVVMTTSATKPLPPPEVKWDRHMILALVKQRGMTLSGIAADAGLEASACRHGIAMRNRRGAEAIAAALGMSFKTLFPDYHNRGHNSEANLSLKQGQKSRPKALENLDGQAA